MIVWCLFAALLLLGACSAQTTSLEFAFDADGRYTGFDSISPDMSAEEMGEAGYVVRSGLDFVSNEDVWTRFVEASGKGEDASVRIATLADDGPYYTDLFYQDGWYYLFDSTAETNAKEPLRYLLTLRGKFGNPERDTAAVVLTDDEELTLDGVLGAMLSSSMDYIRSISPYRLVMFL